MFFRVRLLFGLILALSAISAVHGQNAISLEDLQTRIDPYFAPELFQDIKDALPQAGIDVWGYDVGDYSGDGANDFVLAFRQKGDGRKKVNVYFFVDEDGIVRLIKEMQTDFIELPIEVGVAITEGKAITTKKMKEDNWEILGYAYRNGVVMLVDRFTTEKMGQMVYETYRNFQSLEGYERYINSVDTTVLFRSDFLTIPSYTRGRDVSSGYQATADAHLSRYITRGSYYWKDERDLTLFSRSAYDDDYLYFNLIVRDDEVVTSGPNTPDSTADRLELWFDMYSLGDRFRVGRRARDFRMKTDSNIYAFKISIGDFVDQQARVTIASSNNFDETQMNARLLIKAVAVRSDSGYAVKLKIPFALFGFSGPPFDERGVTPFGVNVVVHDVDNPYRPEETTTVTTSQNFDKSKPATFGALVLVPKNEFYGESTNIYLGEMKERLQEVGF